jgi:hypothetical protein
MSIVLPQHEKTEETRQLEEFFRQHGFADVESYRYNPSSIRVRLRDERFRKLSTTKRFDIVNSIIGELPEDIQHQLIFVLPFAVGEEGESPFAERNREFEDGTA